MSKLSPYERLYRIARANAVDAAGGARAFAIIGTRFAAALVRSEILHSINAQDDEHVNPLRMIEFARYADQRVVDEINEQTL